jgi:hypothetical protein
VAAAAAITVFGRRALAGQTGTLDDVGHIVDNRSPAELLTVPHYIFRRYKKS